MTVATGSQRKNSAWMTLKTSSPAHSPSLARTSASKPLSPRADMPAFISADSWLPRFRWMRRG